MARGKNPTGSDPETQTFWWSQAPENPKWPGIRTRLRTAHGQARLGWPCPWIDVSAKSMLLSVGLGNQWGLLRRATVRQARGKVSPCPG